MLFRHKLKIFSKYAFDMFFDGDINSGERHLGSGLEPQPGGELRHPVRGRLGQNGQLLQPVGQASEQGEEPRL